MLALAVQVTAESGGQVEEVARAFGVDWPHLGAQMISFGIVCAVLYALAYKPILRILEARRQQIAGGLANAEKIKAELARIEAARQDVLTQAGVEGKQLIDEARAAAPARGRGRGRRSPPPNRSRPRPWTGRNAPKCSPSSGARSAASWS
jgi:F-type H+-transporting ATPase subunit b